MFRHILHHPQEKILSLTQKYVFIIMGLQSTRCIISRVWKKRWIENKHLALWHGPCSIQRQDRELNSGPDLAKETRLLSFNLLAPEFYI
jgi:hypothetical protein